MVQVLKDHKFILRVSSSDPDVGLASFPIQF